MSAKIYDETQQAFVDAETPKVYSGSEYVDSKGMSYDSVNGEWVDVFDSTPLNLIDKVTPSGSYTDNNSKVWVDTGSGVSRFFEGYSQYTRVFCAWRQNSSGDTWSNTLYDVTKYKNLHAKGYVLYFGNSAYSIAGYGGIYDGNGTMLIGRSGQRAYADKVEPNGNWGFDPFDDVVDISNITEIKMLAHMSNSYGNWYLQTDIVELEVW